MFNSRCPVLNAQRIASFLLQKYMLSDTKKGCFCAKTYHFVRFYKKTGRVFFFPACFLTVIWSPFRSVEALATSGT